MSSSLRRLASRMDNLYEYDREPVEQKKLQSGWQFAGLFAGEHVAATEFVIGAFFVLHGVRAADLMLGLLIGNTLAVLSWTFVCAPIAVRTRLTLYWYLRRIAGPGLTLVYNVLNALLYCVLAGAMISVSATAVSSVAGIRVPALDDVLPSSAAWVAVTFVLGIVFTAMAILGFEKLSKFGAVCSPWLFPIFIAGAVATLPRLGVHANLDNLWEVMTTRIWNGVPTPGQERFGMAQVIFFAWFCNLAMHIGLSDMALLRYGKNWKYGLYTAFGVYPGHMLCWMCSGVMVAGVNRQMNPGMMAFEAAGWAGVAAVLIAGWTTANPTLYRAGLGLGTLAPDAPRWKVTLAAGLVTSLLACFPVFFLKLLDYVAIYGLVLMPMGAVVLAEHWIFPWLGLEQYRAQRLGQIFNWRALVAWIGTLAACFAMPLHLFFLLLPGYFIAVTVYTALQWVK
jgi:cytosine permease